MRRASIVFIVGTRPEAIKLAPVAAALKTRGFPPQLLFTGQHPLDPADFGLSGFRTARIDYPGGGNPTVHSGMVARAAEPRIAGSDLIIVQGDTSSALGGALAAKTAQVPLAHVEAGLRSHDPTAPWPEEDFRVAIDSIADLLFAPTELSAANLRRERVTGAIYVTGNTAIDALLASSSDLSAQVARQDGKPRLLITCHRRENWGDGLQGVAASARRIAALGLADIEIILHPNPAVAGQLRALLSAEPGIALLEPTCHRAMLTRMLQSDLILSDSGGLQEEAPMLGTPLLVLRDTSERPEAIASGNMAMVGTDADDIVAAVGRILRSPATLQSMRRPAMPHGDGLASQRIAAAIDQWLMLRAPAPNVIELRRAG